MSTLKVDTIQNVAGVEQARLVQVVNTETGAVATGTTVIPFDDTPPLIVDGDQYMTLAITPTHASNKLLIQVVANVSNSAAESMCVALFQDTTSEALACTMASLGITAMAPIVVNHNMTAGTTSSTTFRVRSGGAGTTTTFNGQATNRKYGGVLASSITISEIRV